MFDLGLNFNERYLYSDSCNLNAIDVSRTVFVFASDLSILDTTDS